jgi:mannose-1-phosphate guanylyltransferase
VNAECIVNNLYMDSAVEVFWFWTFFMESLHAWAAVLAGGNGSRLSAFTKTIAGDDRPKQFCSLLGSQTLAEATAQRIDTLVAPDRTLYVVTAAHQPYYADALRDVPPRLLLEQPANRGTATAIAWAVTEVRQADPRGVLGIFPSDHHYDNPIAFRAAVSAAYECAATDPERVFLLGVSADRPEEGLGWIATGGALPTTEVVGRGAPRSVDAFIEKPSPALAQQLFANHCLWNTFVMVGHVDAYSRLIESTCGNLLSKVAAAASASRQALLDRFAELPSWDFSRDVLAPFPGRLAVIPLFNAGWTDLGEPSRVLALMAARMRLTGVRRTAAAS